MISTGYAMMHFLVDLLCAWALFSRFFHGDDGYFQMIVYNFCAFALQLPFGTLLDLLTVRWAEARKKYLPLFWAAVGVLFTLLGTVTEPWILGCGNALFHVGGGVDVLREDHAGKRRGALLGIFVAPGAIGLYLGTLLGKQGTEVNAVPGAAAMLALLLLIFWIRLRRPDLESVQPARSRKEVSDFLVPGCFAVVILRSLIGFCTNFSWKADPALAWCSVLAVASGKMAGGICAAAFGNRRAIWLSLTVSSVCFLFGSTPFMGICALFFFNMTMPLTLYLLAVHLPALPGFSFGLLTFGLFLGFLPAYFGSVPSLSPEAAGAAGSVLSLLLLLLCQRRTSHGQILC